MVRRPAPPSSRPATAKTGQTDTPRASSARRTTPARVDVREWTSGIRLSGFMVIMLSLVILGAWVLVPTLGTFIDQRQKIAALEASVQVTQEEIAALEEERDRWQDPAYISAQARERLYYVYPGEVVYLVDNDLSVTDLPPEQEAVSSEIEEQQADWMPQILRSVVAAGLAQNAVAAP